MSFGWEGQVARVQGKRKAYRVLVGKLEGRAPHGRPPWIGDNIKIDLK